MVAETERRFILERQKAGIEARDEDGAYQGASPSVPVAVSRMSVWRVL
jgi:DNA invertase Pin-like site-specific DNA recombinase